MEIIQIMSINRNNIKAIYALPVVIAAVLCCGCLTYSFGNVAYNGESLDIEVFNNGDAKEVTLQVTVFDLSGFRQVELGKHVSYVVLETGKNDYKIPFDLEKGSYKLYLYVIEDGKRSSAVIRNIEVV